MIGKIAGIKARRKARGTFMCPVRPDDKLSRITGQAPQPLSELTRRLWDYIRAHDLQDKQRKIFINADMVLEPIFNGRRQVTMLELGRLVAGHVIS